MRAIILLLSIITHLHIDAMKRLRPVTDTRVAKRSCLAKKNPDLPTDMLCEILKACPYYKEELTIITDTIKAFALTHKALCACYNNAIVFNYLLDTIHQIHHYSHENILNLIHPPVALKQMVLQNDLRLLLLSENSFNEIKEEITELISKGVRLDFTYDYTRRLNSHPTLHTPLMLDCEDDYFNFLLENGSNINEKTSKGTSVLMRAAEFPIVRSSINRIIEHPSININQTNNCGETALLRCIRNREGHYISSLFVETIKKLLKKGADPLQADRNGCTPLSRAKELCFDPENRKNTVITLIEKAINKKTELLAKDFS